MRACDACHKLLSEDMVCVTVNIYGKLREVSNDVSGLGKADAEYDFCVEHGMKLVDFIKREVFTEKDEG